MVLPCGEGRELKTHPMAAGCHLHPSIKDSMVFLGGRIMDFEGSGVCIFEKGT